MSVSVRTQCPHCQTTYPMPESKLGNAKARATCGKCKQTFLLNDNLVSSEIKNVQALSVGEPQTTKSAHSAQPSTSTDSFSVANKRPLDEQNRMDTATARQQAMPSDPDEDGDDDFDLSQLESLMNANLKANVNAQSTPDDPSTKDVHQNQEDAWLDELLKNNDTIASAPLVKTHPHDDMSDVLGGVDIDNIIPVSDPIATQSPKDLNKKIQARLKSSHPTQEQLMQRRSLGSQILWGLGCLLLLGVLGGQYVFFNLDRFLRQPEHASKLHDLCTKFPQCQLPWAEVSAFSITPEIKEGKGGVPGVFAVIQNTSGKDQLLPNLKVTVMGDTGVVGEFIATPDEYQLAPQRVLASGQRKSFLLSVDAPKDAVTSAKIEPFY